MSFKGLILGIIFLFSSQWGVAQNRPYTLVLLADTNDPKTIEHTLKLREKIKNFDPFRRMNENDFVIKVDAVNMKNFGCKKDLRSSGTKICDEDAILSKGQSYPYFGHHVIVVLPDKFRASTGKVALLNIDSPIEVAVHEFMHLHGFADEYDYDKDSADLNEACDDLRENAPNMALLDLKKNYKNRDEFLKIHKDEIPWTERIEDSTELLNTDGGPGTPSSAFITESIGNPNSTGIFIGGRCKGKVFVRPFRNTIMKESISSSYMETSFPEIYKEMLVRSMEKTSGHKIKLSKPLDSKCFAKFDMNAIRDMPGLVAFQGKLRRRLEKVLPKQSQYIPAGLFHVLPAFQKIDQLSIQFPECFALTEWKKDPQGNYWNKHQIEEVLENSSVSLSMRAGSLRNIFQSIKITVNMEKSCNADARKLIPSFEESYEQIDQIFMHPIFQAAVTRALGRGETERGLADAVSYFDYKRDEIISALLGERLYDDYVQALKENYYTSPDFSCSEKWREIQDYRKHGLKDSLTELTVLVDEVVKMHKEKNKISDELIETYRKVKNLEAWIEEENKKSEIKIPYSNSVK